jgi:dTMP kinase
MSPQGQPGSNAGMDAQLSPAALARLAGRFIVFEGPDGSGKSTQMRRLATELERAGVAFTQTREPGGTPVGEKIREALLTRDIADMSVRCEMLLYMASRAQLCESVIRPALARGELVLADRFVASTLAYQGAAGGLPAADIAAAARVATRGLMPDLYVLFDIDTQAAARRLSPLLDRMEAKGAQFHAQVREGYLQLARAEPLRYAVIDASQPQPQVWASLVRALESWQPR